MPCALPESPSPTPGSREGLPQRPPPYGLQSPGWDSVGDRVGRTTQTESGNKIKGLLYPGGDKETGHPRIGLIPPGLHHFLLLHAPDLTPRGPSPSTLGLSPRRVLNKLNFSVPEDVMRKIAQCAPGVVELVLLPLRQRLEERQRLRKQRSSSLQELAPQDGTGYMDVGLSQKARGEGAPDPQGGGQLRGGRLPAPRPPEYSQAVQGDPSFVLQIAEKEQELLASQETVQVLQMKVRRLEHLLQLKNVRIEDLSRRLQQAERKQR
ncbi:sperm flagellar protein 1 isoform X1 [Ursus arctos]|uniref:sperm flagellar protein 1 isoform X1 n=1 Tax=Ursus arctos TaxID=9644 RepID=UPI0025465887|nr:sperm flagellar protein 1 isoform X1 [Ursus arctos]